jgi:hypothetical protein
MSIPQSFEMVKNGEVLKISFQRLADNAWGVLVDGVEFAIASKLKQNEWVVSLERGGNAGRLYRGRTCQPAVMDCVKHEYMEEEGEDEV